MEMIIGIVFGSIFLTVMFNWLEVQLFGDTVRNLNKRDEATEEFLKKD